MKFKNKENYLQTKKIWEDINFIIDCFLLDMIPANKCTLTIISCLIMLNKQNGSCLKEDQYVDKNTTYYKFIENFYLLIGNETIVNYEKLKIYAKEIYEDMLKNEEYFIK